MKFGNIDHIILFGGAPLLKSFACLVSHRVNMKVTVFSSKRHLEEILPPEQLTLKEILNINDIRFFATSDINTNPHIRNVVTKSTLGIGMGEVWSFKKDLIDLFDGRLLDFMGIRLPQYRGGAHYSWQIMRQNRIGCCNLQIINEDMIQGVFDSGHIVKTREYLFPPTVRIPQDYFDYAVEQELHFLESFLEDVRADKDFPLTQVQEIFSMYFPRLFTPKHGYIDWEWSGRDIERFICAFDDPYPGATTFLNGKKVRLKDCYLEFNDGPFHPFQTGLVYKKDHNALFTAAREGTLIIKKIFNEDGTSAYDGIKTGDRLYTPRKCLEEALLYRADFDSGGLVNHE